MSEASARVAEISAWVDDYNLNQGRDREALAWHRVSKVAEESGEALAQWLLYTGQNPRKGQQGSAADVIEELLDVAVAALGAVEHLMGNHGVCMEMLVEKINKVYTRAGLA